MVENTKPVTRTEDPTAGKCLCGCGEQPSSSKTLYRPGHDARHVSVLIQTLKDDRDSVGDKKIKTSDARLAAKLLPTTALQAKLLAAVNKVNNPPKRPSRATATPKVEETPAEAELGQQYEDGEGNSPEVLRVEEHQDVKVGRWFYPARTVHTETGSFEQRNTKTDGTGEWVIAE